MSLLIHSCLILFLCNLKLVCLQQLVSPCPELFTYEPRNPNEPDKWYGTLKLISDADLSGVWLRLIFNKPSLQLGNWFGEVVTTDNKEYLVKNPKHQLKSGVPQTIRFYIKYDISDTPPMLTLFRLNAKTVCPVGGVTTPEPQGAGMLFSSSELSTTKRPFQPPPIAPSLGGGGGGGGGQSIFSRPGGSSRPDDSDDFFQGDFSQIGSGRPSSKPSHNQFDAACGTVVIPPKPLITNGQGTSEGEFPWHAALYHARGIDLSYICGASLISKSYLVTVAHCVTRRKSQSTIDPDSLVVYLGKYYLKRWANPGIQDRHVNRILVHPKYNSQTYQNDIAVLELAEPAKITNYVRPICLWEGDTDLRQVVNKSGTVVGWGFDETGKVTEELTKAQMPIVAQDTCIYSFPDFFSRFTSATTFCAGFQNGTSVCNGDSGGGLVIPKTDPSTQQPVWYLRGLVSISVALQNQFKCDSYHYVVFTDVAKFLDFIQKSIS